MTVLTAEQHFRGDQAALPSLQARLACRAGMATTTAGVANGFVQGNLAILPEKLAASFHRFCQLNPKPCPVIGMSDVGDPRIPSLGIDLDIRAVQITSRFPAVHGAPVHLGHPHSIGIADIAKPDYGDAVPVEPDEIPVFWACGVTPQAVLAAAKLPFAITHAPGLMLVTDLKNKQLAVL